MVKSGAATVEQYLAELPADRRRSIERVRDVVLRHLPEGYQEMMTFGMIGWGIPLEAYPDTYNGQPVGYAALASQKNFMTLYLMGAYADPDDRARLEEWYAKAGKRLDMGKSCLHFRNADELPLDLIGELIAKRTPRQLIELMESARARARKPGTRKQSAAKKAAARKPTAKKSPAKKSPAKKSSARKSSAKKSAARKAASRKR